MLIRIVHPCALFWATCIILTQPALSIAMQQESPLPETTAPNQPEHVEIPWTTDLALAQQKAAAENKNLMLFFTGSDWCGFCIKLHDQVLTRADFAKMVDEKFVPVMLDFPHNTKLADELTAQNADLKAKFEVRGFPTTCVVDPQMRMYGSIVGYPGVEKFLEKFDQTNDSIATIRQLFGNESWETVKDPQLMAKALAAVPEEALSYGWVSAVEKLVKISKDKEPELYANWSGKLIDLQDKEYIAQLKATYQKMVTQSTDSAAILDFLNQELSSAESRTGRLRTLFSLKADFLTNAGRVDEAIVIVDQVLKSDWASQQDLSSMQTLKTRLLFSSGRIAEGRAAIAARLADKEFDTPEARQVAVLSAVGQELFFARQYSLCIQEHEKVLALVEPGTKEDRAACHAMSRACDAIGGDLATHAEHLLRWSRLEFEQEHVYTANTFASKAAILFRGAGMNDRAEEAIAAVKSYREATVAGQEVAFGQNENPRAKAVDVQLEAASGSQADALVYLSRTARDLGRVSYLMQAASAYRAEGDQEKAVECMQMAKNLLQAIKPESIIDQESLSSVQEMVLSFERSTLKDS